VTIAIRGFVEIFPWRFCFIFSKLAARGRRATPQHDPSSAHALRNHRATSSPKGVEDFFRRSPSGGDRVYNETLRQTPTVRDFEAVVELRSRESMLSSWRPARARSASDSTPTPLSLQNTTLDGSGPESGLLVRTVNQLALRAHQVSIVVYAANGT